MRFWDASALVPLLLREPGTDSVRTLLETDSEIVTWWGSPVECASAVARLRRNGALGIADENRVLAGIDRVRAACHEI